MPDLYWTDCWKIVTSKEIINYNVWSLVLGSPEAVAVRVVVEYRACFTLAAACTPSYFNDDTLYSIKCTR